MICNVTIQMVICGEDADDVMKFVEREIAKTNLERSGYTESIAVREAGACKHDEDAE